MDRSRVQTKIDQVRGAIPTDADSLWALPRGRSASGAAPSQIEQLYEITYAPRCGSMVFWTIEKIEAGRHEATDDFEEWEFLEPEPERWAPFGRCAEATVYLHTETGAVAVTSADEIKAGSRRLRRLAPDIFEFFDRFALGPEYPTIAMDPSQMTVHLGDEDGWLGLLESAGCYEPDVLRQLKAQWDGQYLQPTTEPPRAWTEAEPGASEREFEEKFARIKAAANKVFKKPAKLAAWDLDRMGIGHFEGASMTVKPPMRQDLWRLYGQQSASDYGVLQFFPDEILYERTDDLAETFRTCGIDPAGSGQWIAIAQYHEKATLLLHKESGEVAGLEPAPARRVRSFSPDLFAFVNEYAMGPRHGELCFNPKDRKQARNSQHWIEFLHANGLI
ncbi:hypothetical protein [Glycomyces algeriensis]|uniref:Uncharacterized protein n=1 Tax=Glycomyces algeriensis TaxID=256037 RepID=A0A9W6G5N3_9ACTN|nr:hypothetical protein [Glycomyces algeriensis]MDA1367535.1 hypothetical protein [Glycomyces algeriensis]MDR7353102.1 hypothetical protein [Glycomyces algeriensis]GLI40794.1 hypothetical protein GALLR39Z86_06440 [Glycomyces algeriensis]